MKKALEYVVKPVFKSLDDTAAKYPDRIGFVEPHKDQFTFNEIKQWSDSLSWKLLKDGLKKGDRVLVILPNSIEFIISFYGIQKAGGVIVPVNTLSNNSDVQNYISIVKPAGAISSDDKYEHLTSLKKIKGFKYNFKLKENSFLNMAKEQIIPQTAPSINVFEDLAAIPFSSGTIGNQKGVALTHSNLYCNIQQIIDAHELSQNDIFINHLPYYHVYGMNVLMGAPVFMGAKQIILSGFESEQLLDAIELYKGTVLFTVPTVLNYLVKHCNLSKRNFKSLRFLNIGGGALNPNIAKRFTSVTGVTVNQAYGLTEASPTTHANPLSKIKPGSIGIPLADTFTKIVDTQTLKEVEPRKSGELWIKGPQIMRGYFRNSKDTEKTIVDGWLRTGDIASVDMEGYTYIVDRLKELIKYKSYQVAPVELENVLMTMERIIDCAVVGKPDMDVGELPVAFVVRKNETINKQTIMEYVNSSVAPYKKIRDIIFIKNIPKSASGKILRRILKNTLQHSKN